MATTPSSLIPPGGPREWIERMVDPRFIGLAFATNLLWLFILFELSPADEVMRISEALKQATPDMRLSLSPAQLYAWLGAVGGRGRGMYATVQWLDLMTPVLSALLLSPAMLYLGRHAPGADRLLRGMALVPLLTIAADWGENISLLRLLWAWPTQLPSAVAVTSVFTKVKLVTVSASYLAVLIGLVAFGLGKLRELRASQSGA